MADPQDEVRFEHLRPHQVRERRRRLDVALLPLGTIEWHGLQNALGLDGLKMHHICCEAVRRLDGGGVVFPTLFWGVPRDSFYVDKSVNDATTQKIAEAYGTEARIVQGLTAHGGMDIQEQWLAYQRLLRMCLEQIAGFGFSSIYICTGHGPLIHFARPAAVVFSRATRMAGRIVTTHWSGEGDAAGLGSDHAGRWETSLMMAAEPRTVDMQTLQQHPDYVGVGANPNAVESDAQFGRSGVDQCATAIAREARWLVDYYPQLPPGHHHLRDTKPI